MTARRLGVMGGTFDPVHNGHLIAAEEARFGFSLDEVLFIPAGAPWQKAERRVSAPEHRLAMCRLATATNDAFWVSPIEIERAGPTYTIDTLRQLREELGTATELFFVTGADAITQILTWKDASETLRLATFIAVTRPGHHPADLEGLGLGDKVASLEIPGLAISSSQIRERVASGRPIRYLVPDQVLSYILDRGLYREL
jgi:nicotinate-nucleotide adenylyltransferase